MAFECVVMGIYLRFEDDSVDSAKVVKQWNVKIISVSCAGVEFFGMCNGISSKESECVYMRFYMHIYMLGALCYPCSAHHQPQFF